MANTADGRRRVLQIFEPVIGGVPAYVLALCGGLRERGWDVLVACPPDDALHDAIRSVGARVHPVAMSHRPAPGDAHSVRALAALIRAQRPAVVHAHSTKAGMLGGLAARARGVPCIYTPHGWAFARRDIGPVARSAFATVERGLGRFCHRAIVTVSDEEREIGEARGIGAPGGVHAVRTGLRPTMPTPRPVARGRLGLDPDEVVAVWIGRDAPQKRPGDLAELARRIGDRVRVVALGHGLAESEAGRRLVAAGGMVAGAAATPDDLLGAGDVFVQTSGWEGLSLAVLEAMAAGLPVVAYGVGGLSEQVREGHGGFLVAPGAVGALASCLARLAAEPATRAGMASEARDRFAAQFTFEGMIDGVEARYAAHAG